MTGFSAKEFIKKLSGLKCHQQSVQTLALWLIHHRKHYSVVIKTWMQELYEADQEKKLELMYLANDVIQNSKKKGPEYEIAFGTIMVKVFKHLSQSCKSERIFRSLDRVLDIWKERGVYNDDIIRECRLFINKENVAEENYNEVIIESNRKEKRKAAVELKMNLKKTRKNNNSAYELRKRTTSSPTPEENDEEVSFVATGEPPEPKQLINALQSIENSASSDAEARNRIARLPPEVSDVKYLVNIKDREEAKALEAKVDAAVELLTDYNGRLSHEMEERNKLAQMLLNFRAEQQKLLAQAKKQHDEYQKKLAKLIDLNKELHNHLENLPDLKQLPDITNGLPPLPTACDLFKLQT